MVRTWLAGTLALIAVPHARPAQQTRSMFGAVSSAQWSERASAGNPGKSCACASFIWPSCNESCPKAGCGLSGGISGMALRPRTQIHCSSETLLRRSFHAVGQPAPAQVGHRFRYPWMTSNDRSFPPVLARVWHDRFRAVYSS